MSRFDCAWTLDLAPELALGVLSGPERAETLEHLSTCAPCRTTVASYTEVVDAITLVAPEVEPPEGFEGRVLRAIVGGEARPWWRRRDGRRRAVVVLMAAAAVAIFSIAMVQIVNAARDPNRDVIATGRTPTIRSVALTSGTGLTQGRFYATLGTPAVAVVAVDSDLPTGNYVLELLRASGAPEPLGTIAVTGGRGSWAGPVPDGLGNGAVIRLTDSAGREVDRGQLLAG
jgi:hypothetical protein